MVTVKKLLEWRLTGETKVLGENLPQRHFIDDKSHMTGPQFWTRAAAVERQRLFFYYYYYLVCEAIGTEATTGLLYQP
jgi:hypothetical protein